MLYTVIYILWIVLFVGCWGSIFRKAGYSFWWGILGIVPIIPLFWLAFATWPAAQQVQAFRAGTAKGTEEDAYALLDEGSRLERRKEYEAALTIYERVAAQWPNTPVANDAQIALDAVREKIQREAALQKGG